MELVWYCRFRARIVHVPNPLIFPPEKCGQMGRIHVDFNQFGASSVDWGNARQTGLYMIAYDSTIPSNYHFCLASHNFADKFLLDSKWSKAKANITYLFTPWHLGVYLWDCHWEIRIQCYSQWHQKGEWMPPLINRGWEIHSENRVVMAGNSSKIFMEIFHCHGWLPKGNLMEKIYVYFWG